jgi:hypothetical protein
MHCGYFRLAHILSLCITWKVTNFKIASVVHILSRMNGLWQRYLHLQFDKTTFMNVATNNRIHVSLNVGYGILYKIIKDAQYMC